MGSPSPSLSCHAFVLAFPFFLLASRLSIGSSEENWSQLCAPFRSTCGELNISYPFSKALDWGCGLSIINCDDNSTALINFEDDRESFQVKSINYNDNTIVIHDRNFTQLIQQNRCNDLYNFTIPPVSGHLSFRLMGSVNSVFRICGADPRTYMQEHDDGRSGFKNCGEYDLQFYPSDSMEPPPAGQQRDCKVVEFPLDFSKQDLLHRLSGGFRLQWEIPIPPPCLHCEENGTNHDKSKKAKMGIIAAVILSSFIFASMATLVCYVRRKFSSRGNNQNVEAFLKDYGSLAPRRYSYSDIKKMTNSFKEKLGQGGFGGVFKGKLLDGRFVAVKVLNHSKDNGEEFINEVASISRTSHVNIVTLLGFCFDGSKRALVYQFMSKGSLEKFIYNKKSIEECPHLGWERLYQIAIGIAQGLEYLHRGCNTRILHFDIKPHNILLDEDFCPKISDFGLAKLCPRKDSIISMVDARGTVGYIAPEVFSRNIGGVSHKSDVYSYGMMVLEMVGGRKNIDAGVDHTSEIYFPHWIYKHIGQGEHLQLDMVMREEEEEIAKKMVLVGLWCIQVDPTNRPSMSKVVDMLEGNLESLPIPPKPYLSSPPR